MNIAYRLSIILYKSLFVLSITFIVTLFLVRIAFNSLQWYDNEFDRHKVLEPKQYINGYVGEMPFSRTQLSAIASDIIYYFNSEEEFLDIQKENSSGGLVHVFNQREIDHMKDVKDLLGLLYRIQEGMVIYLMLVVTIGFFMSGGGFTKQVVTMLNFTGYFTILLVALLGLISSVAFNQIFILFHQLSFSNDKWVLNPQTSNLIRMFPTQFWLESATLIGMLLVLVFVSILLSLFIIKWWVDLKQKELAKRAPQYLSPEF
jgi:integral membrane protein (TIGR01906 family)